MKLKEFFLIAGEPSGDLHGAALIEALKKESNSTFTGVGGPKMREQGMECLLPMEEFTVMGFAEIITSLPRIWKQFQRIKREILSRQPACVILIDYPGFNLRMANSLRKNGYSGTLIQYICPTVWAWGKGRIEKMAKTLDLLLVILPFEPACFSHTSLKTRFVGHPLVQKLHTHTYQNNWYERVGLDPNAELLALFPGSRKGEILGNLPKQLQASLLLKREKPDLQIAISCIRNECAPVIEEAVKSLNLSAVIVPMAYSDELMRTCRTAIAKSGTVTLELALHHKPTIVVYEVSAFNRFVARYLLRLNREHFCLVNILAGKTVFPELIAEPYTAQSLFEKLLEIDREGELRQTSLQGCEEVRLLLQDHQASHNAAKAILEALP